MEKQIKIYVVGTSIGYARFITNYKLVDKIEDADLVLFTGGEDINPEIYNEPKHYTTYYTSTRDSYEIEMFKKIKKNQLIFGTCRGAQLICGLYGGKLVQNINNHVGNRHPIRLLETGEIMECNSLHHQMQFPFTMPKEDYTILAVSPCISNVYEGSGIDSNKIQEIGDIELVLYHPKDKPTCIGVQGHPEMMSSDSAFVHYLNNLINIQLKKLKKC